MYPADRIKKLINESNVTTSSDADQKILTDALEHLDKLKQKNLAVKQPNIWRTIMKSPVTKIAAAAVIIISVVFLITFFDKTVTRAYALEQTIEANHTIKTVHLRMFGDSRSIENNEFSDYWIKYDDAGKLSNLRCNEHDKNGVVRFTVWNEGIKKTWIPDNNVVIIIRLNNTDKEWEDFAKEFEPKFSLQWLYDMAEEKEVIELEIDVPAEDSNSIYVKATHPVNKVRAELVVDRKTKLIKKISIYRLREQEYELDMRTEFLAYNQPIEPSMFELRGIPDNAKVYDQIDRLVGLEQDDLTNKEIAAKVVREGLEATIAKDYDEVSRLMEGDPGDTIEEFIEKEFEARLVRIISIGPPEKHDRSELFYVPCEVEVENEEGGRCTVNIIATAKAIEYQDDRWIMHTDLQVSGLYIPSTGAHNAQNHIEGKIFFRRMGVVDVSLGMSKDEVLRKLGKPNKIFWEREKYTLDNLPKRYFMAFDGISFEMADDAVTKIFVHSLFYTFANGLGVGGSEEKIKQTFGDDFLLRNSGIKDFLIYEDKGLEFEIHKKNGAVMEFTIYQPTGDNGDSDARDSGKAKMLSEQSPGPITFPKIDKHIIPEPWHRGTLNELPPSISEEFFQIDLQGYDLSSLDLRNALYELLHSEFNSSTVWPAPDKMPKGFDLNKIMKYGKNPGLNIKSLHNQGITGKNMGIAIIDQVLLTGHEEYRDRLRFYEEIHIPEHKTGADSHASGVASVAAGTSIGVAPEADIYFIGCYFWEWENHPTVLNFKYIAQAVRRIIAINRQLPNDRKIQAISISRGFEDMYKGYDEVVAACYEAKAEGLFVVCANIELLYNNFDFHALGRDPLGNPNDFNSYKPGNWWEQVFYNYPDSFFKNEVLLVPSGSRVKASDTANDHYKFSVGGGQSYVVPYVAGLYVLAKQVNSEITPEQFCSTALQTGRTIQLQHKEKTYSFGKIVDPVALINAIQSVSAYQDIQTHPQTHSETQTIVPGLRVGAYTLDMSKDDVLKELGEPEAIHLGEDEVVRRGEEKYTLNNLPRECIMAFGDVSFFIHDDSAQAIFVRSPLYKLSNGLGVGDSEEKIKQAFGDDFHLREALGKHFLRYDAKGLGFEIHKKNQTVAWIVIYKPEGNLGDRDAPDSRKVIMLGEQPPGPITFPKIDRRPKRAGGRSGKMKYGPEEMEILKLGKNPGLGVHTLHKRGITGKGVGVAIIDHPLLTEHQEYADRLRLYEENNIKDGAVTAMHGSAVASIAVGKTVGVAPDADLYYIATMNGDVSKGDDPPINFRFKAQSIRRLLEINRQLPADRKIRVISMSRGWSPSDEGYDEIMAACEEAKAAGIFLISFSIEQVYGFKFYGLGRHPLADPDVFESYEPGLFWAKGFYDGVQSRYDRLLVPMDSRTTADFRGIDEYLFYREGAWSWAVPYIAGVYALAVQVEPEITPDKFWSLAMKTGRTIELENKGKKIPFGPILDPVKLIDAIKQ